MKKLFLTALLALGLTACGDDDPPRRVQVVQAPAIERQCQIFYDHEELGMVTQCFDRGSKTCFTLYEPDGDIEYYCGGVKMWEIEPSDGWVAWDFDTKKYKAAKRPAYISNSVKPTKVAPKNYKYVSPNSKIKPNPNSNAKKALAAASKQTNTPTPNKNKAVAKPKVDLTKKAPVKPKVDLTKKAPVKPKVDLTKKAPVKPKVDLTKKPAKPKINTVKKKKVKVCELVKGKKVCEYKYR